MTEPKPRDRREYPAHEKANLIWEFCRLIKSPDHQINSPRPVVHAAQKVIDLDYERQLQSPNPLLPPRKKDRSMLYRWLVDMHYDPDKKLKNAFNRVRREHSKA